MNKPGKNIGMVMMPLMLAAMAMCGGCEDVSAPVEATDPGPKPRSGGVFEIMDHVSKRIEAASVGLAISSAQGAVYEAILDGQINMYESSYAKVELDVVDRFVRAGEWSCLDYSAGRAEVFKNQLMVDDGRFVNLGNIFYGNPWQKEDYGSAVVFSEMPGVVFSSLHVAEVGDRSFDECGLFVAGVDIAAVSRDVVEELEDFWLVDAGLQVDTSGIDHDGERVVFEILDIYREKVHRFEGSISATNPFQYAMVIDCFPQELNEVPPYIWDAIGGNSGTPVFAADTGNAIGLLAATNDISGLDVAFFDSFAGVPEAGDFADCPHFFDPSLVLRGDF